jgi:hypothetical protein
MASYFSLLRGRENLDRLDAGSAEFEFRDLAEGVELPVG